MPENGTHVYAEDVGRLQVIGEEQRFTCVHFHGILITPQADYTPIFCSSQERVTKVDRKLGPCRKRF